MIQDYYSNLTMMDKKSVSDGMGGFGYEYTDGAGFKGLISTVNTMERILAEQQGIKTIYRLTIDKTCPIKYDDIIKRESDKKTFRVASNPEDIQSPAYSQVQIKQTTLEEFTIPN